MEMAGNVGIVIFLIILLGCGLACVMGLTFLAISGLCPYLFKRSKHVRIVKIRNKYGNIRYIIQLRHFVFFWRWTKGSNNFNSPFGYLGSHCEFDSFKEAKENLIYWDPQAKDEFLGEVKEVGLKIVEDK